MALSSNGLKINQTRTYAHAPAHAHAVNRLTERGSCRQLAAVLIWLCREDYTPSWWDGEKFHFPCSVGRLYLSQRSCARQIRAEITVNHLSPGETDSLHWAEHPTLHSFWKHTRKCDLTSHRRQRRKQEEETPPPRIPLCYLVCHFNWLTRFTLTSSPPAEFLRTSLEVVIARFWSE